MPSTNYLPRSIRLEQTAEAQQVPRDLPELTPEQWAMWRRHPVTAVVLGRYLPDFRAALERQALNGWVNGTLSLAAEQEARGYLLTVHLVETLSLDQVRVFYGLDTVRDQAERDKRP